MDDVGVGTQGEVRYPEIVVQLTGTDGNAFAILGGVRRAMQAVGVDEAERKRFLNEAIDGDYDHLLATVMRWVTVT